MNKLQKAKYQFYLIAGIFYILTMFPWWNLFTILSSIGGFLLALYASICLRRQKNIFEKFPKSFHYLCRITTITFIVSFVVIESIVIINGFKKDDIKPDYIVVLGAAIKDDKPSTVLSYRLDEAYKQYLKYPSARIVCSGGKAVNEKYSEAEVMRKYLMNLGIPKEQILLEDNSFTTHQNLTNTYELVNDKNATFLIVTNNFHAYRAKLLADKIEMNAYSSPSQKLFNGFTSSYIREYFSIIKVLIFN